MSKYEVFSPEFERFPASYDRLEPAEWGHDYTEIDAPSQREAIRLALQTPAFALWVTQARRNGENPYAHVKAKKMVDDAQ